MSHKIILTYPTPGSNLRPGKENGSVEPKGQLTGVQAFEIRFQSSQTSLFPCTRKNSHPACSWTQAGRLCSRSGKLLSRTWGGLFLIRLGGRWSQELGDRDTFITPGLERGEDETQGFYRRLAVGRAGLV